MAYFDSAKNRAIWQEELAELTAERERRSSGHFPGAAANGRGGRTDAESPRVRKITFAELLEEHRKLSGKDRKGGTARTARREAQKEKTPEAPSLKTAKKL